MRLLIARVVVSGLLATLATPAFAQSFQAPRFDALEAQKQALDQNQSDAAQKALQRERDRMVTPQGAPHAAQSAVRQLDLQSQIRTTEVQRELDQVHTQNERAIESASLPNRRVSRTSVLVVRDPISYSLPAAPKGFYYARVDGRFVLVDGSSELVVKVLDPQPLDPRSDVPTPPAAPLQPANPDVPVIGKPPPP